MSQARAMKSFPNLVFHLAPAALASAGQWLNHMRQKQSYLSTTGLLQIVVFSLLILLLLGPTCLLLQNTFLRRIQTVLRLYQCRFLTNILLAATCGSEVKKLGHEHH